MWHGDKVRTNQINKLVLIVVFFSVAQGLYKDFKERKQAAADDVKYAECLKKNGYDKDGKKEYDVDDLILNIDKYDECAPSKK